MTHTDDLVKAQDEITKADIYTQLRIMGFTEEELNELKATKRSVGYLQFMLWFNEFANEEYRKMIESHMGIDTPLDV